MLILGGARSGKSAIAERMARDMGGRIAFLATAEARDEEMRRRIEAHRSARPPGWRTVEEPLELAGTLRRCAGESDVILVDCLTLWLSNHLCRLAAPEGCEDWRPEVERLALELEGQLSDLLEVVRSEAVTVLVVSNEVGLGLVPATPLGRAYRDLLGTFNRRLAAEAQEVLLMVAGLPIDVKRLSRPNLSC